MYVVSIKIMVSINVNDSSFACGPKDLLLSFWVVPSGYLIKGMVYADKMRLRA